MGPGHRSRAGWGQVTGFEIESESILRARETYPEIIFEVCPVEQSQRIGTDAFDIVCCFNSFYAFDDQPAALRALAHTAKPGAKLAIFDYTDPGSFNNSPLGKHIELLHWQPLILPTVGSQLTDTGWSLETIRDVTTDYTRWYKTFASRIHDLKPKLVEECGIETWTYAANFYDLMHDTIRTGGMGGAIVYAQRQS